MPKKFIPQEPVYPKEPDSRYSDRLRRTQSAYKRVGFSYLPDQYTRRRQDAIEHMNTNLQLRYSDCVSEELLTIQRVALPQKGMFEFEDGTIDEKGKIKSAIVYKVQVNVYDPEALKLGFHKLLGQGQEDNVISKASSCQYTIGRYLRPAVIEPTEWDRMGNITNARIDRHYWTYTYEDTKSNLNSIIKKFGKPARLPVVCIANQQSSTHYSAVQTVIDENDFWGGLPVEDIILGSKMNLPVSAAKVWDRKKQELIAGGSATEAQLAKLTTKNIVDMIQQIEVQETKRK